MRCVSLCSGLGGLELGLSLVTNCHPVAFIESDSYCQRVLAKRWPGVAIHNSVEAYEGEPCDILTAGFPCQPWSCAGKQRGREDERWIWDHIERVICSSRPEQVCLENVPGLVSGGGLAAVLWSLAALGYNAAWGVFSCRQLGAPHYRKRVFILANAIGSRLHSERTTRFAQLAEPSRLNRALANPYNSISERFWPPGPNGEWGGGQVRAMPAQPRIPRVVDGVSCKLERSNYTARVRALGNAVSPPVAAVAYVALSKRLAEL
jgi:DNA-cytosine methyltransferase